MNTSTCIIRAITIALVVLCTGTAAAWDMRWQFRQQPAPDAGGTGTREIEMRKKLDLDSMNRYRGTTDGSSGYTVLRNSSGDVMRGFIQKDGSGLLRDQNGHFHNVNTRW
jgi:hypothetical protein